MSQQDILDFLEKNKRKQFTTQELAENIGITRGAVRRSLVSLRKAGYVSYDEKFVKGVYKVYYSHAARLCVNNCNVLKRFLKNR